MIQLLLTPEEAAKQHARSYARRVAMLKPKIKRSMWGGSWVCIGHSWPVSAIGKGATAVEAYDDYLRQLQDMRT